jgi:hypothetical protein
MNNIKISLLLLLCMLGFHPATIASDTWNKCYYEQAKQGAYHFTLEKFGLAASFLEEALQCGKGFPLDYYRLAVSYSKQDRLQECQVVCEKLVSQYGYKLEQIQDNPNLSAFAKSGYFTALREQYESLRAAYHASLDMDLVLSIMGMVEKDQYARELWGAHNYDTALAFIASRADSLNTA